MRVQPPFTTHTGEASGSAEGEAAPGFSSQILLSISLIFLKTKGRNTKRIIGESETLATRVEFKATGRKISFDALSTLSYPTLVQELLKNKKSGFMRIKILCTKLVYRRSIEPYRLALPNRNFEAYQRIKWCSILTY